MVRSDKPFPFSRAFCLTDDHPCVTAASLMWLIGSKAVTYIVAGGCPNGALTPVLLYRGRDYSRVCSPRR